MSSYHIQHFEANDVWPVGGWSVYKITGDEIAARIIRDKDGKVTERHSWCGYLGIATTWDGVLALMQDGRPETTRQMASGSRRKVGGMIEAPGVKGRTYQIFKANWEDVTETV